MKKTIESCLIFILVLLLCCAVSWGITVVLVKLITMCFHMKFSLLTATGVWLITFFISLALPGKKAK